MKRKLTRNSVEKNKLFLCIRTWYQFWHIIMLDSSGLAPHGYSSITIRNSQRNASCDQRKYGCSQESCVIGKQVGLYSPTCTQRCRAYYAKHTAQYCNSKRSAQLSLCAVECGCPPGGSGRDSSKSGSPEWQKCICHTGSNEEHKHSHDP